MVTYHLYALFAHIYLFRRFFHAARAFPHKIVCHPVAPYAEIGMRYRGFGMVYSISQFDSFIVLPPFLMEINELEESSAEEDGI